MRGPAANKTIHWQMDEIDVQTDIIIGLDQRELFNIPRLRIRS